MFSDLSDHLPVFLILKKKEITKTIKERPMVRLFGEKNIQKFTDKMTKVEWKKLYETNDPNIALDIFYREYSKAYNESFPLQKLSRKLSKDKKWITHDLKHKINNNKTVSGLFY